MSYISLHHHTKSCSTLCVHRLSACIKSLAIGKPGGLPILRHESWILDTDETDEVPTMELENYLKPMIKARNCAEEILMKSGSACLADLQRLLKSSSGLLLSMDRSFRCELEWLFNAADEHLATSIQKNILNCMPTSTINITLAQACTRLESLMDSDKVKFGSLRSLSEIKTVKRILDKMLAGVSPDRSVRAGGEVFEKVWDRLQYFIMVKIPSDEAWKFNNPGVGIISKYCNL